MADAPLESLDSTTPSARILSNGRWTTLVTGAGTGFSAWRGLVLTRCDLDRVEDPAGVFVYLRDLESGAVASIGAAPCGAGAGLARHAVGGRGTARARRSAHYEAGLFELGYTEPDAGSAAGAAAGAAAGGGLEATLAICVHPERDVEIRRIRLRNGGARERHLEVTVLAEVVLFPRLAQESHPAFAKLFVETALDTDAEVVLARRRPRSRGEATPWLAGALAGPGTPTFETDRARFLGRGRSLARPAALDPGASLSGTLGSVLDPVFAVRRRLALGPGEETELAFALAIAETRAAAVTLACEGLEPDVLEQVFTWAQLAARARLGRMGLEEPRAEALQALAGAILYGDPTLRADAAVLARARGPLRALDRLGVRRDVALVTIPPELADDAVLARDAHQAEAYWRALALPIEIRTLRPGELNPDALDLLLAWSSYVVESGVVLSVKKADTLVTNDSTNGPGPDLTIAADPDLTVNGIAGRPPMPWANVVANERAGFIVSESGAACTWVRNSRENKLTPWYNDPVADPHGEALYVRDLAGGACWSPTPGPRPAQESGALYHAQHDFGASSWRHESHGLVQETTLFVPREDPLRIAHVALEERSGRERTLSVVDCARLQLGALLSESARFVTTAWDAQAGILFARGVGDERADEVTFAAAVGPAGSALHASADRAAFLGRRGSPEAPEWLLGDAPLGGEAGAGLDACAALEVRLRLAPHASAQCAFLLGEAATEEEARALVARYRAPGAVERALSDARGFWDELTGALEVETPSRWLDPMANGWLAYQTLSCRLFARSAYYQSGGAFGFRDQLQDAVALTALRPEIARAQILLHAAHQFPEGDVLHWWHAPSGRGVRTRISDDLLWLPYLTAHYLRTTGDTALLDARAGFVTARALAPGEDDAFLEVPASEESDTLYGHCIRAIERSFGRGAHGLPLMGTGDWNDGMNRVGREGRGESVWLGFFLYDVLGSFAAIAEQRGEADRAARYREHRTALASALEDAWDGAWYRRAYTDEGEPLGSAACDECRIDVLPQAWAAMTGAVSHERATRAMESAYAELVSMDDGMIRLLTPPFDKTALDPGYIKGYVPGIRENGGQYTHGALWLVRAMAELGWRERAAPLLERLSPGWHTRDAGAIATYQVEPYVVAADVYSAPQHVGRGGWTWYTGSAAWFLRVLVESILGVTVLGGTHLQIRPCVPDAWPGYRVRLHRVTIEVQNPRACSAAVVACRVDGVAAPVVDGAARIALRPDGGDQHVVVELGPE